MMTSILFVYAKLNPTPDIEYRQGMHELLAPLVFVVYSACSAHHNNEPVHAILDQALNERTTSSLCDSAFIEHDSL